MTAALVLRGLRKSFGPAEVIRGTDLEVTGHERLALIGPNGAGKSTLFSLVSGQLRPDAGTVELLGRDVTGRPPHEIARAGLGRSFQVSNLFAGLSVRDNLACAVMWPLGARLGLGSRRSASRELNAAVDGWLDTLGLGARAGARAGDLSYAEQRLLEVGMTAAGGPRCLLLDEPTSGMSKAESHRMIELIRRISEGRTLVMIEHDMSVVFDLADRIAVLVYGQVIAVGPPAAIRADPQVQDAYFGRHARQQQVQHA